jgi:hypothetical protein
MTKIMTRKGGQRILAVTSVHMYTGGHVHRAERGAAWKGLLPLRAGA